MNDGVGVGNRGGTQIGGRLDHHGAIVIVAATEAKVGLRYQCDTLAYRHLSLIFPRIDEHGIAVVRRVDRRLDRGVRLAGADVQ